MRDAPLRISAGEDRQRAHRHAKWGEEHCEHLQTHIQRAFMALSWLFLLMLAASSVSSARIAGFHMIGGSQYINTKLILEELASRGHEVF